MVIVYILCIFLKHTQSSKWDKENGDYTQTSPINVERLYVEVTAEGSEGFVLGNQKQLANVTNDPYFVMKEETKTFDFLPFIRFCQIFIYQICYIISYIFLYIKSVSIKMKKSCCLVFLLSISVYKKMILYRVFTLVQPSFNINRIYFKISNIYYS